MAHVSSLTGPHLGTLSLLVLLTACAMPRGDAAWAAGPHLAPIGPDRFQAGPQDGPQAVPQTGPQTVLRDGSPWSHDHPRGRFLVETGLIDFEHDVDMAAPRLNDETDATLLRLHFETSGRAIGGGVAVEITSVDDDLHTDMVGITGSDTSAFDVYGFFMAQTTGERFRMPMRIGLSVGGIEQELEGTFSTAEFDYFSVGVRFELEPEVDLVKTDAVVLGLYTAFSGGVGAGVIDLGLSEDFSAPYLQYGLRAGVRFSAGNFTAGLSYVYNNNHFDESDPEVIGATAFVVEEADFTQSGVLFTAGIRW